MICLVDFSGEIMDEFSYVFDVLWLSLVVGGGFFLYLKDNILDNDFLVSWEVVVVGGMVCGVIIMDVDDLRNNLFINWRIFFNFVSGWVYVFWEGYSFLSWEVCIYIFMGQ